MYARRACRILDRTAESCWVSSSMRRGLKIRVAFSPTRLSADHLRAVYEVVTPMIERVVIREGDAVATRKRDRGDGVASRQRRGAR